MGGSVVFKSANMPVYGEEDASSVCFLLNGFCPMLILNDAYTKMLGGRGRCSRRIKALVFLFLCSLTSLLAAM